jgi:predicted amidophosphoribosyltransferase
MRCLNCKYDLRKRTEHRCPECGRDFDPKDASTFESEQPTRTNVWFIVAIAFLLLVILMPVVAFLYAMAIVGDMLRN